MTAADSALQEAVASRDLPKIMALYTADAVLMNGGDPPAEGAQQIRQKWEKLLAGPVVAKPAGKDRIEISEANDLGYTVSTYAPPSAKSDESDGLSLDRRLSVWKRQSDGSWRMVADTYRYSRPANFSRESQADRANVKS